MHRPLLIAALLLLLASLPLSAQHGGGHASGGHGGMAAHGGFAGHMGGSHGMGGMHSSPGFGVRSSARRGSFARGSFAPRSFRQPLRSRGFNHFHDRRFRSGFRNNCFGRACRGRGFPWWYAGAFDPYWWWDSGSSYDEDREREIGLANEMNAESLEEQRMREQGDQDTYARSAPQPLRQEERPEAVPATVLVFRDQHKREVQNYAIVGRTLWNFAPQHTEKIPLSDLDLPATAKANDERGVDFHVPGAQEGQ
jgi:hypothetical protein